MMMMSRQYSCLFNLSILWYIHVLLQSVPKPSTSTTIAVATTNVTSAVYTLVSILSLYVPNDSACMSSYV